jgi:hypothetical protein
LHHAVPKKGTKLGSVTIDVKGNKGSVGKRVDGIVIISMGSANQRDLVAIQ